MGGRDAVNNFSEGFARRVGGALVNVCHTLPFLYFLLAFALGLPV